MMNKFSLASVTFFLLLLIVSVLFLKVIAPFLIDIFLAIILAQQFWGLFHRLKPWLGARPAALSCVVLTLVVILLPLFLMGFVVTDELLKHVDQVKTQVSHLKPALSTISLEKKLASIDKLQPFLKYIDLSEIDFQEKLQAKIPGIVDYSVLFLEQVLANIYQVLFHFFMIVILQYYFLVDGKKTIQLIKNLWPMQEEDKDEIFREMAKVIDGIIQHSFLLGLVEALAGLLLFFLLGVPAILFWLVLLFISAVIPVAGSGLIYIPAAFVLLVMKKYWAGLILMGLSLIVPNYIQNVVKPRLVGNKVGLSPSIILITTFGGIFWLGLIGFIIGPFIGAMFMVVWRQYGKHYNQPDA